MHTFYFSSLNTLRPGEIKKQFGRLHLTRRKRWKVRKRAVFISLLQNMISASILFLFERISAKANAHEGEFCNGNAGIAGNIRASTRQIALWMENDCAMVRRAAINGIDKRDRQEYALFPRGINNIAFFIFARGKRSSLPLRLKNRCAHWENQVAVRGINFATCVDISQFYVRI